MHSVSVKETHLSHTFAWWGSPRPGNRWSSSAQCWPCTEGRRRDGITEEWSLLENTAQAWECAQQGKSLSKCSSGKREEKLMGENCFFILGKKSVRKTLNAAIIVRKKAKIRLVFVLFFWHWGHQHNMLIKHVHGNEGEKSWKETGVIIPFKKTPQRFEREAGWDGQNAPMVDLLCEVTDRRKH